MKKIDDFIDKVICGDTLEVLKEMPDESIDLIITSPPYYGLRNYQIEGQIGLETTFEEYLEKLLKITAELKRVLKNEGQLWWNMGDCYYGGGHGGWKKFEEGFIELKDPIYKGRNTCPVIKWDYPKYNAKCLLMQPERLAIRMIDEQGWILRNKVIWTKQVLIKKEDKTIGSVIPSSVKDRFNESWEYLYFFTKSKKYYSNLDAVRVPITSPIESWGSGYGIGFNYRVSEAERKAGQPQYIATKEEIERYKQETGKIKGGGANLNLPWNPITGGRIYKQDNVPSRNANMYKGFNQRWKEKMEKYQGKLHLLGKNIPTVWQISPEPHNFKEELGVDCDHFATFPEALCEIPIKFGCPSDGIVLDPFCGSGTALVVAKRLGRHYIGIDLNPNYCKIAKRRLSKLPERLDKFLTN